MQTDIHTEEIGIHVDRVGQREETCRQTDIHTDRRDMHICRQREDICIHVDREKRYTYT